MVLTVTVIFFWGGGWHGNNNKRGERGKKKGKIKGRVHKALCSPVTSGLEILMGKKSWEKELGGKDQDVGKYKGGKGTGCRRKGE